MKGGISSCLMKAAAAAADVAQKEIRSLCN